MKSTDAVSINSTSVVVRTADTTVTVFFAGDVLVAVNRDDDGGAPTETVKRRSN